MPGAVVLLKAARDSREFSTTTEASGSFRFDSVPAGRYQLEAVLEGFSRYHEAVVVKRDLTTLQVQLQIARVDQQMTVQATGGLRPSINREDNLDAVEIDRDTLDKLPVLDQDIVSTVSHS